MRSELERVLLREWFVPPGFRDQVIYHYTSVAGLIGILESHSIRGTTAMLMNDTSEVNYGVSLCKSVVQSMLAESALDRPFLERVDRIFDHESTPSDVFLTSFTAADDVLGHWRGYGSDAGRYSIAFRLSRFSERDALRLPQKVEYDVERQRERVRKAIMLAVHHADQTGDRELIHLALYLQRLAFIFKHPGFAEEREWRSVSTLSDFGGSEEHLRFDVLSGIPRPYITMLSGSRETTRLPIIEVRVGAIRRQKEAVVATRLLLQKFGYHDVAVTESKIPMVP